MTEEVAEIMDEMDAIEREAGSEPMIASKLADAIVEQTIGTQAFYTCNTAAMMLREQAAEIERLMNLCAASGVCTDTDAEVVRRAQLRMATEPG